MSAPGVFAKAELTAWAEGPAAVRWARRAPVVGGAADRAWRWWFNRRLEAFYDQRNAPAVAAFRAARPTLDSVQQRVLDELEATGVAVIAGDAFFGAAEPMATLRREAEVWLASPAVREAERRHHEEPRSRSEKAFLVRMYGRGGRLAWDSPWLRAAMHERLLGVANSYLGMWSRLHYVDVWNTLPVADGAPDTGSQRWHRDPEAPRLLKVFAYFTDVDERTGPLTIVPRSRRGDPLGGLWPQRFPGGSQPPAEDVDRRVPAGDRLICAVPAGTLVFADTTCLHRGGRVAAARRVLSVMNYVPPAAVWPRATEVEAASLPPELAPAARSALTDQ